MLATKYPVGTALLETPFYLAGRLCEQVIKPDGLPGFTKVNEFFRIVSALFYLFWGFYLLGLMLLKRAWDTGKTCVLLFLLFCGSNLFYFAVWQPAMSHLYSLFCITAIVYLLEKSQLNLKEFIALGVLTSLTFVIRNINVVFLGIIFIYYFYRLKSLIVQFRFKILYAFLPALVIVLPWWLYKHYLHQHHITAYDGEGFIYWKNPKVAAVLLSATNGVLIHTPWVVMVLGILFYHAVLRKKAALAGAWVAWAVTLVYASWWCYTLGCGLGHRAYLDFLPFILFMLVKVLPEKRINLFIALSVPLVVYTSYLAFKIPPCFDHTAHDWDYREFEQLF